MQYTRHVYVCDRCASDLGGESIAAFSAASLVFNEDKSYSAKLIKAAEDLFDVSSTKNISHNQGTYTTKNDCGGQAIEPQNSSGYKDELIWGRTWLFFVTGNYTYLDYVTCNFGAAEEEELPTESDLLLE